MSLQSLNKLNVLLLDWNMSNKVQRFGQYIESNSNMQHSCIDNTNKVVFWELGQELYESDDSYYVYSEVVTLIEKGVLV